MSDGEVSLYFGLKEGEKADLEIVATAAIHWSQAVRAAARELNPNAEIRIELIDAHEGSLKLNPWLDWAEEQLEHLQGGSGRYPRLRNLAIALAVFLPTVGYPTYDFYFGDDPVAQLSADDRERLDEILKRLEANPEVKDSRKNFFQTVEKDRSITEVGVSEGRDRPPVIKFPRNRFPEQSNLWALQEEEEERTNYEELEVTLIAPMLVPAKRAWTFDAEGRGEFSAKMTDEKFLKALEQEHVKEQLRFGIRMKIRLKIEEEKIGGIWKLKHGGRSVVKVLEPEVD